MRTTRQPLPSSCSPQCTSSGQHGSARLGGGWRGSRRGRVAVAADWLVAWFVLLVLLLLLPASSTAAGEPASSAEAEAEARPQLEGEQPLPPVSPSPPEEQAQRARRDEPLPPPTHIRASPPLEWSSQSAPSGQEDSIPHHTGGGLDSEQDSQLTVDDVNDAGQRQAADASDDVGQDPGDEDSDGVDHPATGPIPDHAEASSPTAHNADAEDHSHHTDRSHLRRHVADLTDFGGDGMSHLKDHLSQVIKLPRDFEDLDDEQLIFYFFKLHDFDTNDRLDGLELMALFTDYHHQHQSLGETIQGGGPKTPEDPHSAPPTKHHLQHEGEITQVEGRSTPIGTEDGPQEEDEERPPYLGLLSEEEIAPTVDAILGGYDLDGDGYLTFAEFTSTGMAESDELF